MQRDPVKIRSHSTARSVKELKRVFEPEGTLRDLESLDDVKMRSKGSSCGVSRQGADAFSGACPVLEEPGKGTDDEVLRNMSKLPGFLQNANEDSVQDKALNFGVIDWKRLEKWKYNERMPGKNIMKTSMDRKSSFSTNGVPKIDPTIERTASLQSSRQSIPSGSRSSSVQRQYPPRSSHLSSLSKNENGSYNESGSHSEPSSFKDQIFRYRENGDEVIKRFSLSKACAEELPQTNLNISSTEDVMVEIPCKEDVSPSVHSRQKFSSIQHENLNTCPGLGFTYLSCSVDKDFPLNASECSQPNGSRSSYDGNSDEETGNRFSDFCSQELNSTESPFVSAHSCPQPSDSPSQENDPVGQYYGYPSSNVQNSITSSMSEARCSRVPGKAVEPSSSHSEFGGKNLVKVRAPSPSQRFSFSRGKTSRSSNLETPVVPESNSSGSSLVSGVMKPEVPSTISGRFQRDHPNANAKGRSSPLRRLLDPFLKHKTAQSSESIRPQDVSLPPKPKPHTSGPSKSKQGVVLKVQAFLRVTVKDELPLYKLVIQTSNSMLVAAVKKLWVPGKLDPLVIYSFYSVCGIKKRSMNWLTKGSNSKTCSLAYRMIGQLRISKSCCPEVSCSGSSKCEKWESALYASDPQQDSKHNSCALKNEIAAIITNTTNEDCNHDEDKDFRGTAVILPGGDHGKPTTGAPSSLVSRWKGSCDCGGWDIGCKLRVLKQVSENRKNLQEPLPNSPTGSLKLCLEGQDSRMDPILSIEPLDSGLYSIKFDDSVPVLEAFATCVAHLTPLKFPGTITMVTKEQTDVGTDPTKIPEPFRVKDLPVKTPHASVGRI